MAAVNPSPRLMPPFDIKNERNETELRARLVQEDGRIRVEITGAKEPMTPEEFMRHYKVAEKLKAGRIHFAPGDNETYKLLSDWAGLKPDMPRQERTVMADPITALMSGSVNALGAAFRIGEHFAKEMLARSPDAQPNPSLNGAGKPARARRPGASKANRPAGPAPDIDQVVQNLNAHANALASHNIGIRRALTAHGYQFEDGANPAVNKAAYAAAYAARPEVFAQADAECKVLYKEIQRISRGADKLPEADSERLSHALADLDTKISTSQAGLPEPSAKGGRISKTSNQKELMALIRKLAERISKLIGRIIGAHAANDDTVENTFAP
jgi:hypothetical protein